MSLPSKRSLGALGLISLGHLALMTWALRLVAPPENISLMWLPDGYLLACLTLLPRRLWAWLMLLLTPLIFSFEVLLTSRPPGFIAWLVAVDLLEALCGALILRWLGVHRRGFTQTRQLVGFILLCAGARSAASAALGTAATFAYELSADFTVVYRAWFSSTGLGVLLITPLLIQAWFRLKTPEHLRPPSAPQAPGLTHAQEHLLLFALMINVAWLTVTSDWSLIALLLSLSLLVGAAVRLGLWGAVTISAGFILILVHATTLGRGPFIPGVETTAEAVSLLQGYLMSVIITTLFIALSVDKLRAAQAKLKESVARHHAVFNHAPISLWEEDFSEVKVYLEEIYQGPPAGFAAWLRARPEIIAECAARVRVLDINTQTTHLFEAGSQRELLDNLNQIFTPRSIDAFGEELIALMGGAQAFRVEAEQKTLKGRVLHTVTNVALTPEAAARWDRVLVSVEDISAHRQAERAARHAQKMEAVGQMSGGIAHDFNNILGVISGHLELLELDEEGLTEGGHGHLAACRRATERAATLTRQLLDFSRRKARAVELVDPDEILDEMGNLIQRVVTPAIKTRMLLNSGGWRVELDRGELEDALLNLIINARDAMPDGGELVLETRAHAGTLSGELKLPPGDYLQLLVHDTGVGISEAAQERIFEPFFTTKPKGKGTGLGLAMVYAFAKRSGGLLEVESMEGVGSSFLLSLPRALEGRCPTPVERLPRASTRGEGLILAVDDEPMLLKIAGDMLERLGYEVLLAEDGHAALKRLEETPGVRLLMTDVVMPGGIDGYELARRAVRAHPHLKVLLVSGYAPPSEADEGTLPLLSKPYQMAALAAHLEALLGPQVAAKP